MFDDPLEMLPDEDYRIYRPRTRDFLADIWKDPIRKKASIFAWISNAMQGVEFSAFGFYLPVILLLSGVSGIAGTKFFTAAIYIIDTISGFVASIVTPKLGHRGICKGLRRCLPVAARRGAVSAPGLEGIPLSTALVSLFSHVGFLAARFILPEVYGYVEHEKQETVSTV
jgi:hypothetical protein